LSVKMVSQQQTKDSASKKLGIVAPQDKSSKEMKSSKKMKFASSSAETEPTSQTTISDDSKTGRGMSTMPRVVKRKLQKVRPIVEYNKMGKGIGQAHIEMQSYIGVLARPRVPLVDKKWSQIPKDVKEQIWEAVDMAFVGGQGGKKSVLASAAKKWKDFKSTLTRHYILPYTNDKEKLSHPPETYKFIEKAQGDAFVASRLSQDFESVHSQHAQIREKLEYNHRLSQKGYAGLEDELEETMPGVEIDRSTLWKRARQDKHGNIPDPKVAKKAKLIVIEVGDYSNMEAPSSLKSLCRYVETTLLPEDKILEFKIDKEVFGSDRDTFLLPEDITQFAGMEEIGASVVAVYMRHLHDVLKQAKMCSMVGFIDPATVSANSGTVAERSRLVATRLQKTDGEQIFMMPYNPGRHWILMIVRAKKETVYFLDPLPGHRVVDEEAKNIVNSAKKIYNSHIGRAGRKAVIWKTLSGTPNQPSSVECGYYVMRFMRDIIMDPSLAFENK
ncbi:PREDICTED: ubiquitin-like-specific, partial [Prunus dulcis]